MVLIAGRAAAAGRLQPFLASISCRGAGPRARRERSLHTVSRRRDPARLERQETMTDNSPMIPAGPSAAGVPGYPMPRAAGCPFDPPPRLRELQAEAPLTKVRGWDGNPPCLVTGHSEPRPPPSDPHPPPHPPHP